MCIILQNYVMETIYFNLDGAKIEENGFAARQSTLT